MQQSDSNFEISIKNWEKDVSEFNYTHIFRYPCDNQHDCTYYDVTMPAGTYMFETWGAQGGYDGGKGGYSRGIIHFHQKEIIHIFIGAKGDEVVEDVGVINSSFNGGGQGYAAKAIDGNRTASAGGGGTDIRIKGISLYNRIIVSGGGGGSASSDRENRQGGCGGGYSGKTDSDKFAQPGNQTSAGVGDNEIGSKESSGDGLASGEFGLGGYFTKTGSTYSGGGGGWYGGSSGRSGWSGAGAGGSGYVLTSSSYKPENYTISSRYYFWHPVLIDGDSPMPTCEGEYDPSKTEIGHSGNGCVRITTIIEISDFITCKPKIFSHLKTTTYIYISSFLFSVI